MRPNKKESVGFVYIFLFCVPVLKILTEFLSIFRCSLIVLIVGLFGG